MCGLGPTQRSYASCVCIFHLVGCWCFDNVSPLEGVRLALAQGEIERWMKKKLEFLLFDRGKQANRRECMRACPGRGSSCAFGFSIDGP